MTKYFVFMFLGACFFLLALPGVAAAEDHGDRVCIYKHDNFQGHQQCFRPGESVSDLKNVDVGSIRVFGHARAMLYEDRDFRGHEMAFTGDMRDLRRLPVNGGKNWHDHVGSLRVMSDYASDTSKLYIPDYDAGRFKPFFGTEVDEGVCVYDRPNYEGRRQCWGSGTEISDLNSSNWQDKIASVRIFGHGSLVGFRDADFHGQEVFIDHDAPDLANVPMRFSGNWNHEISSLQVR
jgi:hypothetical protein